MAHRIQLTQPLRRVAVVTRKHRRVVIAVCGLCALPGGLAAAQHPGELTGTVVDAVGARTLDGVDVVLPGLQRATTTDAAGRFALRGLEPGEWLVRAVRLGYETRAVAVVVRNGETTRVTIRLAPVPVRLDAISASTTARSGDAMLIDRATLRRSGARTAGDALRAVPGLLVQSTGPGTPQLASVRGMAADALLVLVDGVPLNDAVTGEADLSSVDASTIASITVLPGAHSARWGPRAAAGVIRIETLRGGPAERGLDAGGGSLGEWATRLRWGGGHARSWSAAVGLRGLDGGFDFDLPSRIGGGARSRENAEVRALNTHAAFGTVLASGRTDVRIGYDALERGLPGRGYAPSPHAGQTTRRGRASLGWRRTGPTSSITVLLAGSRQRLTSADPLPPLGQPWADTTDATFVEARVDGATVLAGATVGAGMELRHRRIGGTVLDPDAPDTQLDAGVLGHAELPLPLGLRITGGARLDRDPKGGAVASHSLTLGWAGGGIGGHLAYRSSYSPPSAGDLYFRDAVGVEANPDLEAERVPGELEVGARAGRDLGAWTVALRALAYRGDVRGMILWAPDYRFVWSPYNQDAKRTGAEVSAELTRAGARLAGSWTYARATYDRGALDNAVQIAYRPRHSASIEAALHVRAVRFDTRLHYTGERTTAASALNTLPGFWTMAAGAAYERGLGDWAVSFELHVDRLFDNDDALIFGFPEPGRVLRLGVSIAPRSTTPLLSLGAPR